ncbi:large terminase [Mycobacterium helveticum]|uniref:Large terminase n=1 Tax=Mycobacterium helveticum TaxID=2592811 RepID=A0A557XVF8_9MYCO|nr:large terminase [Mycobacterium helveticum]TVS86043.1 large terminase [Mycobacterium helveticum]TVS90018.1 large terminase [Mycobacterium helveticum]
MSTLYVPDPAGYPTLGDHVVEFIEARAVFGPGSLHDQPARLDREKQMLIRRFYEIYPQGHPKEGQRVFDRCAVELRKGVAKTELAAWIAFCELHPEGPVRFNGFEPDGSLRRGRPVKSPYIPMMATAEEQSEELAYGVLRYICEQCPDAHLFDPNLDRIARRGLDGMAVPVSNSPNSRDGARNTFQHFDEPHRLTLPRDRAAVETMLQNLPKRQLESPWALYTSTAGAPGQGSVEEDVRLEAEQIADGRAPNSGLFFFARWADVDKHPDLSTVEQIVAAVAEATGPAVGEWGVGQFERAAREFFRVGADLSYLERVHLNRWRKSNSGAYDMARVRDLVLDEVIPKGAFVTVGFDGARYKDATAIVITDISTGYQQIAALWERPEDAAGWEVDEADVDGVMHQVFKDYQVWRAYCDPPYWTEVVARWAGKWPDQVVEWFTGRQRQAADMARAYKEAIDGEAIRFVGTEGNRDDLVRHIGHAGRKDLKITDDEGQPLWMLCKLNGQQINKFDACMAGNLSWQARLDAIADGAKPKGGGAPRRLY